MSPSPRGTLNESPPHSGVNIRAPLSTSDLVHVHPQADRSPGIFLLEVGHWTSVTAAMGMTRFSSLGRSGALYDMVP